MLHALDGDTGAQHRAGALGRAREGRDQQPGVDGVVAGDVEGQAQRGRERGLQPARRRGQEALGAQPQPLAQLELALQRLCLVAVACDHERAAGDVTDVDARQPVQLGGERGPAPRAAQPELEQRALARVGLGHGGEHARGHRRRRGAEVAAVEHDDAQPARASAPRDGQPGDPSAEDGHVVGLLLVTVDVSSSLRRHDPDQLLTVGGCVPPSQPRTGGLPCRPC